MPNRLQPIDYEGVSRRKSAKSWSDEPEAAGWKEVDPGEWSTQGVNKTQSSQQMTSGDAFVVRAERRKPFETPEPFLGSVNAEPRGPLKRGHTITFAGIFLFTFIVFMRPYEFFPSLAWASSSALVVAIFTLLVYLVTQLGLDGTLTIRPREVNLALVLLILGLL